MIAAAARPHRDQGAELTSESVYSSQRLQYFFSPPTPFDWNAVAQGHRQDNRYVVCNSHIVSQALECLANFKIIWICLQHFSWSNYPKKVKLKLSLLLLDCGNYIGLQNDYSETCYSQQLIHSLWQQDLDLHLIYLVASSLDFRRGHLVNNELPLFGSTPQVLDILLLDARNLALAPGMQNQSMGYRAER